MAAEDGPPPHRFGPYEIDRLIGRGGMGEVHRAHDTRRDRMVALKRISPHLLTNAAMRERFGREAALAARLNEPHVIPVHDFGEIDGQLYIDMRLVDGVDLGRALRRHRLTPRRAVDVVGQIADALDAAHRQNLVHRDVKPSNILLAGRDETQAVERGNVYLTDFGTASLFDPESSAPGTGTTGGGPVGTLVYMAPERFSSARGDQRGDVYSLACLLWESLTGSPPFAFADAPRVLYAKFRAPPVLRGAGGLPVELDEVFRRGLAVDPRDRFPSAGALAAAAARVLEGRAGATTTVAIPLLPGPAAAPPTVPDGGAGGPARPPEPATRIRRGRRARQWLVPLTVAVTGSLLIGAQVVLPPLLAPTPLRLAPVDAVAVGTAPAEVVVAPDGTRAYVSNQRDDTVSVVDLSTRRATGPAIPVGEAPNSVAVSSDGRVLLVTSTVADVLTVIDTSTSAVVAAVPVPSFPDGLAVAPDGSEVYVVSADAGTVTVVDATTWTVREPPIAVGLAPYGAVVTPDGDRLYVTNSGSDDVSVVDTGTRRVVASVRVGDGPVGAAVTPDGRRVLVANLAGGTVEQIDTASNTVSGTPVGVGGGPLGIEVTGDGRRLLVTTRDADSIVVVSLADARVEWSGSAGFQPVDLATDPTSDLVYVVREGSDDLGVFAPVPS